MPKNIELQSGSPEHEQLGLLEAINSATHVTLEFGTGDLPLFEAKSTAVYDEDNLYIGVNIDPMQHVYLKDKAEAIQGFAILNELDGNDDFPPLPIPDNTIDTVFMANVFGEPDSNYIMHDFQDAEGKYNGNSDIDAKLKTMLEAKRVMKPGGHLVILENNTPYRGDILSTDVVSKILEQIKKHGTYDGRQSPYVPFKGMVAQLEANGLTAIDAVTQRDADWSEIISHYADPEGWWSDSSYLVIATKA